MKSSVSSKTKTQTNTDLPVHIEPVSIEHWSQRSKILLIVFLCLIFALFCTVVFFANPQSVSALFETDNSTSASMTLPSIFTLGGIAFLLFILFFDPFVVTIVAVLLYGAHIIRRTYRKWRRTR